MLSSFQLNQKSQGIRRKISYFTFDSLVSIIIIFWFINRQLKDHLSSQFHRRERRVWKENHRPNTFLTGSSLLPIRFFSSIHASKPKKKQHSGPFDNHIINQIIGIRTIIEFNYLWSRMEHKACLDN